MAQDIGSGRATTARCRVDDTQIPTIADENEQGTASDSKSAQTTEKHIEKAYSCFTSREKWGIIISTNIYTPAIPTLADAFDVPVEKINLTLTVYL
jgi:hypothetical protein